MNPLWSRLTYSSVSLMYHDPSDGSLILIQIATKERTLREVTDWVRISFYFSPTVGKTEIILSFSIVSIYVTVKEKYVRKKATFCKLCLGYR